jgi:hypothetical protein
VLKNTSARGIQTITVSGGATSYSFPPALQSFDGFSVTVGAYPTLPTQLCTIQNQTGTIQGSSIGNVNIDCINAYLIKGTTVTGLTGSGLRLSNSNGDILDVPTGATSFQFFKPVPPGGAYDVQVAVHPSNPWQTCTVSSNPDPISGNVGTADVLLAMSCNINSYTLGVNISNLQYPGLQLTLTLNGVPQAPVSPAAGATTHAFGSHASGTTYGIAITGQPTGQNCTIFGGLGTITGGNVTASISCSMTGYPVGGSTSNLNGTITMTMTGSVNQSVTVSPATSYVFPAALSLNNTYTVSISVQPGVPADQTCAFGGDPFGGGASTATGTVGTTPVTLPTLFCVDHSWDVGKWDAARWK